MLPGNFRPRAASHTLLPHPNHVIQAQNQKTYMKWQRLCLQLSSFLLGIVPISSSQLVLLLFLSCLFFFSFFCYWSILLPFSPDNYPIIIFCWKTGFLLLLYDSCWAARRWQCSLLPNGIDICHYKMHLMIYTLFKNLFLFLFFLSFIFHFFSFLFFLSFFLF